MSRWSWSARYDEDPDSVPIWFRLLRSTVWLTVVIVAARYIWRYFH